MCQIIYRADDGKEFDNAEDCKKYNSQPFVWIVVETRSVRYFSNKKNMKVFASKKLGEEYIKHHKDIVRNDDYSYTIESHVVSNGDKVND